jgi:hypothetical protein
MIDLTLLKRPETATESIGARVPIRVKTAWNQLLTEREVSSSAVLLALVTKLLNDSGYLRADNAEGADPK